MSNTLNSTNPIQKPQDTQEQKSDLSLIEKENNSDYSRRNIFKWFTLFVMMIIIFCIALLFLHKLFTSSDVQKYIIDQLVNNVAFIIVSCFAILKINIPNNKT